MSKTQAPLSQIDDNPHQARLGLSDVDSLAESILQHGLRQLPEARLLVDGEPASSFSGFTVREDGEWHVTKEENRTVELASGHRRTEAIRHLNADDTVTDADLRDVGLVPGHVPVDLQRLTDEEMLDLATIENADRDDLSAIEQARLIKEHVDAGRTTAEIGERFSKSASWASNRKRLLGLPQYVQVLVHEGDLSVRQGQALVKAFQLEAEHEGACEKIKASTLSAGNMATAAKDGSLDSDGIRGRVAELEEAIKMVEQAEGEDSSSDTRNSDIETDEDQATPESTGEANEGGRASTREETDPGAGAPHRRSKASAQHDGSERASEAGADTGKRAAVSEPVGEPSGDGAPGEGEMYAEYAPIDVAISKVEARDWLWEIGQQTDGQYHATVWVYDGEERIGSYSETDAEHPGVALLDAFDAAVASLDDPIGTVDRDDVDALLSCKSLDMWDEKAAERASIASLLVAHRVAGKRQELWRTEEIAKVVDRRAGSVTEEDVPDEVLAEVEDEVARRLEAAGA